MARGGGVATGTSPVTAGYVLHTVYVVMVIVGRPPLLLKLVFERGYKATFKP